MKKITKLFFVTILIASANFATAQCYTPLYSSGNLCPDPEMTNIALWNGWGAMRQVVQGSDAYCGDKYMKLVSNGIVGCSYPGTNGEDSALDINLTWAANTTYRLHVRLKTVGGNVGFLTTGTSPNVSRSYDTAGQWQLIDLTFTTGATAGGGFISFNTCDSGATATEIQLDNYELYALDPLVVSKGQLAFSESNLQDNFFVKGNGLTNNIALTSPVGITLSQTTIPVADAPNGVTVTATWDGTTIIPNDVINVSSGSTSKNIKVIAALDSSCFTPLSATNNMVSDPTVTNIANFGGWGNAAIVYGAAGACGVSSALLTTDGVIIAYPVGAAFDIKNITWAPNKQYRVRALVKTVGGKIALKLGGIDGKFDSVNSDEIDLNTNGVWQLIDYTFTTGSAPTNGFVSFNSSDTAGGAPIATETYIDNLELYRTDILGLNDVSSVVSTNVNAVGSKIFVSNVKSSTEVSVYGITGALVKSFKTDTDTDFDFKSGLWIVKIKTIDGEKSVKLITN